MRAILSGFIRQAATLERFKQDPCAENALRVCFDFSSGDGWVNRWDCTIKSNGHWT